MAHDPPALLAGLAYIVRGWPVLVLKPRSKEPLTKHAVKDATVDPDQLRRWFERWPNANIGIACGTPGPDVLDVDDLIKGAGAMKIAIAAGGPDVATVRGRQFYVLGTTRGTIVLEFGELRSTGSYVVAPPSLHPEGKFYVWVTEPSGLTLPRLPDGIVPASAATAGAGEMVVPAGRIPYGQRHGALKDICVRLIRSGVLDEGVLAGMLEAFYGTHCELEPLPEAGYFTGMAAWGMKSRIATRERLVGNERSFADQLTDDAGKPKGKAKRVTGLENPPGREVRNLAEHRDYVNQAGGWGDHIDVDEVVRLGQRGVDALRLKLTNGQVVQFERQEMITTRGVWFRTVAAYTNGEAKPVSLNEFEAQHVFRSLCILAAPPPVITEAEEIAEMVRAMVAAADVWNEHDLSGNAGRYDAIRRAHARGVWTPRSSETMPPVVLIDCADGRMHLRAGEVLPWSAHVGLKLTSANLPGRMLMIGAELHRITGRAQRLGTDGREVDKRRMSLYRLADGGMS